MSDPMTGGDDASAGDQDVPLHVEIQDFIEAVRVAFALNRPVRQPRRRSLMESCPKCHQAIREYDDHATGCPLWGALPGDF